MQEFLLSNKVSCNLMSLTGYRTLIILSALLDSPKTNDEINDCFLNNQYIKERFSGDTLRLYINSLREIGCDITKASKLNKRKYTLLYHPFEFDIKKSEINALHKIYKTLQDKIEIQELIMIETLLEKIAENLSNLKSKEHLLKSLLLKKIDNDLLKKLLMHCEDKNQIIFSYNSPKSKEKNIEIIADKIACKRNKLYIWGYNLTHSQYSFFPIERINKICAIKLSKDTHKPSNIKVVYEISSENFDLEPDEKIISQSGEKITVEVNARNEFEILQRIMSFGAECKVIEPIHIKTNLINKLKLMEKIYEQD